MGRHRAFEGEDGFPDPDSGAGSDHATRGRSPRDPSPFAAQQPMQQPPSRQPAPRQPGAAGGDLGDGLSPEAARPGSTHLDEHLAAHHERAGRSRGGRFAALGVALVVVLGAGGFVVTKTNLIGGGSGCGSRHTKLTVVASPDIAPALTSVADYAKRTHVQVDGACLAVSVVARTSSDEAQRLAGNGTNALPEQVWIPDSSLWVDPQTSPDATSAQLSPQGSVASSPVVLGVVSTEAKKLGWPKRTFTWSQMFTSHDAPKIAMADPDTSSVGLLALSQVLGAFPGKSKSDQQALASANKELASRVSTSDTALLGTLPASTAPSDLQNPKKNQAMLLSEQSIIKHDATKSAVPLDIFYPSKGTAALDYPYTLVNNNTMAGPQTRAAASFLNVLQTAEGTALLAKAGFRNTDDSLNTTINRSPGYAGEQPSTPVLADTPQGKAVDQLRSVWKVTVSAVRLLTVVDVSGSMSTPVPGSGKTRMQVVSSALSQALGSFTPEDSIGAWEFAHKLDGDKDYKVLAAPAPLATKLSDGKTQKQELSSDFSKLSPQPGLASGLNDTVLAAYQDATKNYDKNRINVMVLLTDGSNQDPGSISSSQLVKKLKSLEGSTGPVPIIAMAIGPDADYGSLKKIASATGGTAYQVSNPNDVQSVLKQAVPQIASAMAG